jgi:hypothetical protein
MPARIFLFIFLLLTVSCIENPIKTEEEKERELVLQNKISRTTVYRTNIRLGIKEKEELHQVRNYNPEGYLIRTTDYSDKNQIEFIYDYSYDTSDNLISITGIDSLGQLTSKVVRSYNNQNKLHELYYYLPDGTYKYRNVRTYDKDGRESELAWYWTTGFKSKNVYRYQGWNKISDTELDTEGKSAYEWKYKYDKRNNLVEAAQYYPGEILTTKIIYQYNNDNSLVRQNNYQGSALLNSIVYTYDSRKLLSSKTEYSPSGKPAVVFRYEYSTY